MSRSLNNAPTMEDLAQEGYHGRDIRFFLMSTHYRKPLNFSFSALRTAKNTTRKLDGFIQRLHRFSPGEEQSDTAQLIYDVKQSFISAMDDDLNISVALAALFEFVKKISILLAQKKLSGRERDTVLETIEKIDSILGIMTFAEESISQESLELIKERESLRTAGQWEKADEIRMRLLDVGIEVLDTPSGSIWRLR
jgi:cysteinyl-tRNA synthetase